MRAITTSESEKLRRLNDGIIEENKTQISEAAKGGAERQLIERIGGQDYLASQKAADEAFERSNNAPNPNEQDLRTIREHHVLFERLLDKITDSPEIAKAVEPYEEAIRLGGSRKKEKLLNLLNNVETPIEFSVAREVASELVKISELSSPSAEQGLRTR